MTPIFILVIIVMVNGGMHHGPEFRFITKYDCHVAMLLLKEMASYRHIARCEIQRGA